jgi:DNA repair exonuclease SbcCD nuclease subunit
LKRHAEYRLVFQRFLDKVKEDGIENSLIYIGGDIAHAKTEMSPELVREISWFLNECSKLREVILITGNHDCNLNNNSRLDVLTPIIENLNNDRVHYLRDTGVYDIHNITFVVYSILDKRENWPKGEAVKGENKICLFHGPVDKSKTDVGYAVSSTRFTTEIFNGFDAVLMGDIHKRQVLQEYDKSNGTPCR